MKNKFFYTIISLSISAMLGCAVQAQTPQINAATQSGQKLDAYPDLSAYTRYEIYSQSTQSNQLEGRVNYVKRSARFDVVVSDGTPVGNLQIQPETCQDDRSADCERRFIISGRVKAFNSLLNCSIPIRNDTNVGYKNQALSGICQSQYGRTFTIQIFSN